MERNSYIEWGGEEMETDQFRREKKQKKKQKTKQKNIYMAHKMKNSKKK